MAQWPVAMQMYCWSQHYAKTKQRLEDNLDEALRETAATGFKVVETSLSVASTSAAAAAFKGLLNKHGLQACALFHGGIYHEKGAAGKVVEQTVEFARAAHAVGIQAIDVNPQPKPGKALKTDEELKIQCDYLNKVGRALKDMGLEFWVHNHDPEALNNAREIRADGDMTDPSVVHLCLDTHWVLRGGAQPLPLLRELAPRVKALHLRNSVNGVWSEALGDGDIDHRAICRLLREVGFTGWLIAELAYEAKTVQTRSLTENLRLSREYVRQVFGV